MSFRSVLSVTWARGCFGICDNKLVCNRYRLTYAKPHLAERFGAVGEIEQRPRYNIAPTQQVVTVRKEEGKKTRKFTTMRWGLIPVLGKRHEHRNPDTQC